MPIHRKIQSVCALTTGRFATVGKIVAIEVDIENADRNVQSLPDCQSWPPAAAQGHAAALDADEGQALEIGALFENLMCQPHQRAIDLRGTHQLFFLAYCSHKNSVQINTDIYLS